MLRAAAALLALTTAAAVAAPPAIAVERLDLGDRGADIQAYNYQELADLRVWALSKPGFGGARIMVQRRDAGGTWSAAEALAFSDARYRDSDPQPDRDGRRIVFVSDRPRDGGAAASKDLDIFETRFGTDGQWSAPRRLDAAVQSAAHELGPEAHGADLFFTSAKAGGPGAMSVYASRAGAAPAPLPAPVNVGRLNSDFTLTPDGRHALWWSDRDRASGAGTGDLYAAERIGDGFGPALRLPTQINGPDFEFTPSVSADGQWLFFASTRPDRLPGPEGKEGRAHVYRTSWPALLTALGVAVNAHSDAALAASIDRFWRALSHGPAAGGDGAALRALLHRDAQIWGSRLRDGAPALSRSDAASFAAAVEKPQAAGFHECEVRREVRRHGDFAQVLSVVGSRRDPAQPRPDFIGINSLQWALMADGWRLLSLHYEVERPGLPIGAPDGPCLSPR